MLGEEDGWKALGKDFILWCDYCPLELNSMEEFVTCRLCGNIFRQVTAAHLKLEHGMNSVYDYYAMFPDAETISEATQDRHSRALSEVMTGRQFSREHLEHLSKSHLELYKTPEGKALIEAAREKNTGREVSEETRKLLSEVANERWGQPKAREEQSRKMQALNGSPEMREYFRQTSLKAWEGSEERRKRLSEAMKERWSNPIFRSYMSFRGSLARRVLWEDPNFASKMVQAWHKAPSGPELEMKGILDRYFPGRFVLNSGVGNPMVVGRKIPDFIGTDGRREIIEVFGVYWHNPYDFPWRLDEDKLKEYYAELGYLCLVIWTDEIDSRYVVEKVNETFPS